MKDIEVSVVVPLWMGQIEGHMQAINGVYLGKTMTHQERTIFLRSLAMIKSSCEAITKNMLAAKEVV